jgi:hypothetical protein
LVGIPFDPVNVQAALGELDLLPLQVAHLGGPQIVAYAVSPID